MNRAAQERREGGQEEQSSTYGGGKGGGSARGLPFWLAPKRPKKLWLKLTDAEFWAGQKQGRKSRPIT